MHGTRDIVEPLITVVEIDIGAFALVGPSLAFTNPKTPVSKMSEQEVADVLTTRFGFSKQTVKARIEVAKLKGPPCPESK
jgi:hypothetical protein